MVDDRPADDSELARQLHLLEELGDLLRRQERARQGAAAEARRLRAVIDDTATQLAGMLAGQRASRAALQALIDELRAAVGSDAAGEP